MTMQITVIRMRLPKDFMVMVSGIAGHTAPPSIRGRGRYHHGRADAFQSV
jgi:hypothetical protein